MVASGFRSHSSRRTMSALKKKLDSGSVCLLIYIIAILYITLFSRPRSLMSVAHFNAFWSYRRWISHGWYYARQILLNIGMFVPLGWLLTAVGKDNPTNYARRILIPLLFCALFSILIEVIQLFSGRGSLDVDDVINNSLGGLIGSLGFILIGNRLSRIPVFIGIVFLGVIGCFMIHPSQVDYTG